MCNSVLAVTWKQLTVDMSGGSASRARFSGKKQQFEHKLKEWLLQVHYVLEHTDRLRVHSKMSVKLFRKYGKCISEAHYR